ncbi:immune inhibitor A domain-containing protein [Catenuloplanes indicus]|uniref:M6 family metalloprotease-like protein n=1 Tax=Catenuloplanes indicus TaxID=137267 RepID=A0AAE4AXQ8_9ACTN|nr:immune inhibitor A domain-containing protein [Catenuloplanes indicus]MDQ0367305.1 M6 family metalloprotease-like protein [Catenuloplanes indicus]
MRRQVSVVAAGTLVAALMAAPAQAAPSALTPDVEPTAVLGEDNLPHPLADVREAERTEALDRLIAGTTTTEKRNGSEVIRLGGNRFVEYKKRETKTDPVLTFLVEFGDQIYPRAGGTPGPLHNAIPEPDRVWDGGATDDNTTIWEPDFSPEHYEELLFAKNKESMANFYAKQSGGRYTVGGDVSDWVKVPYNEARYGSNSVPQNDGYWNFIKDSATAWYDAQLAAGKTPEQVKAQLKTFDIWDRDDFDDDGDFNEPDGYVDHFQAVHAGAGEEAGGGAEGTDAIWAHRWYAFSNLRGTAGPAGNLAGGVQIGDTGIWIGDYTTEPENGGLGVFVHEYGHDLGLPDLYDTAGGENGTGFWSVMSSGSWLGRGNPTIGSTPGYMGAWEKIWLGWSDFVTINPGKSKYVTLGSAAYGDGILPEAVVIPLGDGSYYAAEYRSYTGYDETLKLGPYNWGWANSKPDWAERFPYQDGLLVWYVNPAVGNNNTSVHPGTGLTLPVDARPAPISFADGVLLGNRRQPFDATFGLQSTDPVTFHRNGVPVSVPRQPAIPVFDDSDPLRYWNAANPQSSVKVAGAGVKIEVKTQIGGLIPLMTLKVTPPVK